jgi:hypothetical protein
MLKDTDITGDRYKVRMLIGLDDAIDANIDNVIRAAIELHLPAAADSEAQNLYVSMCVCVKWELWPICVCVNVQMCVFVNEKYFFS